MANSVECKWQNGVLFEISQPKGKYFIEAGEAIGGTGKGMGAKAQMLSALAGCTALDVIFLAKKMRATPEDFNVIVSGELTDEHPKYYHKVKVEYQFFGKELKKDKLEKSVYKSVDKYCGVMEMFRQFAKIEIEINYFE